MNLNPLKLRKSEPRLHPGKLLISYGNSSPALCVLLWYQCQNQPKPLKVPYHQRRHLLSSHTLCILQNSSQLSVLAMLRLFPEICSQDTDACLYDSKPTPHNIFTGKTSRLSRALKYLHNRQYLIPMCLGLNTMARSQNDAKWIQMKNAVDLFKMVQLTKWARRLNIYHCQTLQYIGSFFDLTTGMFAPARSSFGPSTHMQITLVRVSCMLSLNNHHGSCI